MSGGQRTARAQQRWLAFWAFAWMGATIWAGTGVDTAAIVAMVFMGCSAVIDAMRALDLERHP